MFDLSKNFLWDTLGHSWLTPSAVYTHSGGLSAWCLRSPLLAWRRYPSLAHFCVAVVRLCVPHLPGASIGSLPSPVGVQSQGSVSGTLGLADIMGVPRLELRPISGRTRKKEFEKKMPKTLHK